MANIFRTISTKFYQNWPGFVDYVTKTFGVFLTILEFADQIPE